MILNYKTPAMWHVLRLIENNLTEDKAYASLNLYHFLDTVSSAPPYEHQIEALTQIRNTGIIHFNDEQVTTALIEGGTGPELQITTFPLEISSNEFYTLYQDCATWQRLQSEHKPIDLVYDIDSGSGDINAEHHFVLKGNNKKAFDIIYKNAGQWVTREQLLRTMRLERDINSTYGKQKFNTFITNLRKATGLTKRQLLQKNGRVMVNVLN